MDPVALIAAALGAGAAATLRDDAKGAVKIALARLRGLVKKRFKDPANGEYILDKHAGAPEIWQPALRQELAESAAGSDPDLVAAAQELMKLLDAQGTQAGKYVVTVRDSQGVQTGDHNAQANTFGAAAAGRDVYLAGRDMTVGPH